MIDLISDNRASIKTEIIQAIIEENEKVSASSYGEDAVSQALNDRFSKVFETQVEVFPVLTGTAANAISLAQLASAYGGVICHEHAHIYQDECGAPEYFSGGRLLPVPGAEGKLTPQGVAQALQVITAKRYHGHQFAALSLTQATEYGTVYTCDEISALAEIAHAARGLVHMDGARFANGVAYLQCAPADISWRAGVDILSFGGSKNGTMNAEAILVFNPDCARVLKRACKQAGQLVSKMRFIACQLVAYLEQNRWLTWAQRNNRLAQKLANEMIGCLSVEVLYPVQANILMARMATGLPEFLAGQGVCLYAPHDIGGAYRLVLSHANRGDDVTSLLKLIADWEKQCH